MDDSQEPLIKGLWNKNVSKSNYGSEELYYCHVFEQYKIFVEMADRISARRSLANSFFLTLHTVLISVAGFTYEKGPKIENFAINIFPLIFVLALCYVWLRVIESYKHLNEAKYKVIGEYERSLPTSPYWEAEWVNGLSSGNQSKFYRPTTNFETWVPKLFMVFYIILFLSLTFLR
jgi:hypothetical protein